MENAAQQVTPPGQTPAQEAQAQYLSQPRNQFIAIGIAVLVLFLAAIGYMARGEPRNFVLFGLFIAPWAILAALAYAGVRSITARVLTYAWLVILAFGVIFNALASVLPL